MSKCEKEGIRIEKKAIIDKSPFEMKNNEDAT